MLSTGKQGLTPRLFYIFLLCEDVLYKKHSSKGAKFIYPIVVGMDMRLSYQVYLALINNRCSCYGLDLFPLLKLATILTISSSCHYVSYFLLFAILLLIWQKQYIITPT